MSTIEPGYIALHRSGELERRVLADAKITPVMDTVVSSINGSQKGGGISLKNKKTGEERELGVEGVFIFVGWGWSLVWTILSYLACLTIIGLPLGLLMFRLAPAMTTLKRY